MSVWRKTSRVSGVAAFLLCLLILGSACVSPRTEYIFQGPTMGTTFTVKVVLDGEAEPLSPQRQDEVREGIVTALEDVNSKMSTYLEWSELSRLNQFEGTGPFPVSKETLEVFSEAQRISAATGGAFDITVGPLVNAWGFGPDERMIEGPTDEEIENLKARVGWSKIKIDTANSAIYKLDPGVYCDLSAIAKGYAVDRVAEGLAARGFGHYMVEVGGEVRALGRNSAGEAWRIAVERPRDGAREFQRVLPLTGMAMATSGDYRNFFERDGQRFSHEIDPATGRPVRHNLASVSVIDSSCMRADGYATALMVLGEEEGFRWASENEVAALFLVRNGETFDEKATPEFHKLFPGVVEGASASEAN